MPHPPTSTSHMVYPSPFAGTVEAVLLNTVTYQDMKMSRRGTWQQFMSLFFSPSHLVVQRNNSSFPPFICQTTTYILCQSVPPSLTLTQGKDMLDNQEHSSHATPSWFKFQSPSGVQKLLLTVLCWEILLFLSPSKLDLQTWNHALHKLVDCLMLKK